MRPAFQWWCAQEDHLYFTIRCHFEESSKLPPQNMIFAQACLTLNIRTALSAAGPPDSKGALSDRSLDEKSTEVIDIKHIKHF
jgi:hypothetical protein